MQPTTEERIQTWIAETRQSGFRHRNWRVIRLLAGLVVALLLASLMMESRQLLHACWIAATMAGTTMLVWFLDDRLFVEHHHKSR